MEEKSKKKINNSKAKGISTRHKPFVRYLDATTGITLVALVVTIVVLLILVGITINLILGNNSIFDRASDAKLQTDIATWKERLETAKVAIITEELGKFDSGKYFEYIENKGIIEDKEIDVVDNGNGTYDVTTKTGYIFEVKLMPNQENSTDAKIEFIGQAGKILPIIKKIETSATSTSITAKAIVLRLGNGTIKYYYKKENENDDTYEEMTNINEETGAMQNTKIVAGENYIVKVVAKNDVGESVNTVKITATKIFVESIELNKTEEKVKAKETVTLTVTILPENATNKNVIWESSNFDVASVDENGAITGIKAGTTTITAKATDGSNKETSCIVTVKEPTIADLIGQPVDNSKNIETKDENGNKIVIPAGFRVLEHGTKNDDIDEVVYNYDEENHKPCVQDGIVIADEQDNQFVWIPIGKIKNKEEDENGTETDIIFGRYTFNAETGKETLQQNADDYKQVITLENMYQELAETDSVALKAKNLKSFVTKAKINGGYYLARYEASNGGNNKVISKKNKYVWRCYYASTCSTYSKAMYDNDFIESDLVNSYAWDTALVFIQKYSGNSSYSKTKGTLGLKNTGLSNDKVCNIHDMAENLQEATTEFCNFNGGYRSLRCLERWRALQPVWFEFDEVTRQSLWV